MLQDAPGSFCLLIGIPDKNAAEKAVHKYKDGVCILNVLLYHVKESFSSESGSFSNFLECLEMRRFPFGVRLASMRRLAAITAKKRPRGPPLVCQLIKGH